jgi:hypothetical protein
VAAEGIELQLMPKISELDPMTALTGVEEFSGVQDSVTRRGTSGQLANFALATIVASGGFPASLMPAFTGEVTAPPGTANLTIDKTISPTWLGLHTFAGPALAVPDSTTIVRFCAAPSGDSAAMIEAHNGTPILRFHRYDGLIATGALPVNANEGIGRISMQAWDGTAFFTGARITAYAGENWTTAAHGAGFLIETTQLGQLTPIEIMRIDPSGGVRVGTIPSLAGEPGFGDMALGGIVFAAKGQRLTSVEANIGAFTWDQINTRYHNLSVGGAAVGWNYTAGSGETDFFSCHDGGSVSGFFFYNFPNTPGPIDLIGAIYSGGGFYVDGSIALTAGNGIEIGVGDLRFFDNAGYTSVYGPLSTGPLTRGAVLSLGGVGNNSYLDLDGSFTLRNIADSSPWVTFGSYGITISPTLHYYVGSTQVVGQRVLGWSPPVGTVTRGALNTGTATLPQVAQFLGALIADLTTHGLIGATLLAELAASAGVAPSREEPTPFDWERVIRRAA